MAARFIADLSSLPDYQPPGPNTATHTRALSSQADAG